jgi:hypothetical protein
MRPADKSTLNPPSRPTPLPIHRFSATRLIDPRPSYLLALHRESRRRWPLCRQRYRGGKAGVGVELWCVARLSDVEIMLLDTAYAEVGGGFKLSVP